MSFQSWFYHELALWSQIIYLTSLRFNAPMSETAIIKLWTWRLNDTLYTFNKCYFLSPLLSIWQCCLKSVFPQNSLYRLSFCLCFPQWLDRIEDKLHVLFQCVETLWSEVKWSEVAQSCPTLWDPTDCSLPGSSIHGIFQARILEWVAISFSRRSSGPRDWTRISCIVGRCFTIWATREAHGNNGILNIWSEFRFDSCFFCLTWAQFQLKYLICKIIASWNFMGIN